MPVDTDNFQTSIVQGIAAFKAAGVTRLIIDVTGNGGGYVCLGQFLHQYLAGSSFGYPYVLLHLCCEIYLTVPSVALRVHSVPTLWLERSSPPMQQRETMTFGCSTVPITVSSIDISLTLSL